MTEPKDPAPAPAQQRHPWAESNQCIQCLKPYCVQRNTLSRFDPLWGAFERICRTCPNCGAWQP